MLSILIFRLLYGATLGLVPDEAYYWDWSRSLSFGYFDHPPMIAWLISCSRSIFGDTMLGVRFTVIIFASTALAVSYLLTRQYVSRSSSRIFFIILSNSIILFGVGSFLATPDVPLICFWSLGLLFAYKALFESDNAAWLMLGVIMGMGLLSKYTFVLFFLSLALFCSSTPSQRKWLTRWQPYVSLGIALIVFSPNLIWNSLHGWVSILFQASHGLGSRIQFDSLGEFISGQIGILSLFPFILLVIALGLAIKKASDARVAFLLIFFFVPFTVFFISSLQKKVEANWAAPAYVSGLICISILWESLEKNQNRRLRRFAVFSTAFAVLTCAMVLWHIQKPFLPLASTNDPASQIRGWKQWAMAIDSVRGNIDPARTLPVTANRYQEAALLAFYLPDHPKTMALNIFARDNQYSLMSKTKRANSTTVLFVHQIGTKRSAPYLAKYFHHSRCQAGLPFARQKTNLNHLAFLREP